MLKDSQMQIYQGANGELQFIGDISNETLWGNLNQIAQLFGVQKAVISKHLKNIFTSGELEKSSTVSKMETVQTEGKRTIKRQIEYFNLDAIISVGYRVNSKQATEFRKWSTGILKNYLLNGYALNQKRLQEKGIKELEHTLQVFRKTIEQLPMSGDEALGLLDIITKYTNSRVLLHKYDSDTLPAKGQTTTLHYKLQAQEAYLALSELKQDLLSKQEATELFAQPREKEVLEGIFGNIYQTFDGVELYPSLEEKASHLLYFIIKNHPFSDGNKRSGAFLFILFLAKNRLLFDEQGERKINERALVAITLLIAQSNPKDKDLMIKLVLNLLY